MSAMQGFGRLLAVAIGSMVLAACGGGSSGPAPAISKNVALSGAQENPAVTTAATGSGVIDLFTDSGAVSGTVQTFGLNATAAHIHPGAVGVNGPVLIPMVQGPPGTWTVVAGATLTPAQVAAFRAGELYVNVHTAANPGGEIRAQIGRDVYYATLTGNQETPPNASTATGTGVFVFDPVSRAMSGRVTTSGVTATAGHIHIAAIGVAAGVAIPFTGGPTDFTMPLTVLTEAQAASLTAGNFYANVHSAALPGGEIRGQLYNPARVANLSGLQEVPPNDSSARGTGRLVVNPFTKGVAGRIETTGIVATAAHVHRGAPTVVGPVVIPMTSSSDGIWVTAPGATISDDLLVSFMKGDLYLNVHSAAFPVGEIRSPLVSGQ